MADKKGGSKGGDAPKPKKGIVKRYKSYENGKLKGRFCPKCGPGVLLAVHKDRLHCGKCEYTEKL